MMGRVDPSHLVALDALLRERHVTRAAKRLGITQSSMSHRLRALRRALGDPLLVRDGAALVLTPRAAAMAGPLASALEALDAAVAPAPRFDPAQGPLRVSLALPDLLMPLVPALLNHLLREAPQLELRITSVPVDLGKALADGSCDLALTPQAFASPSLVRRAVGKLRFGVVARHDHPVWAQRLTIKRWLAHGHVVVSHDNDSRNVVQAVLEERGHERHVALRVPSFLAGLSAVGASDLVMNAPRPLVDQVLDRFGLAVANTPIPIPVVPFALLWHERFAADPAHTWARSKIHDWAKAQFRRPSDG